MEPADEELIAATARGERDAFGALYRRRRPDVFRFAVHMTGSPSAAEDIVQDVFLAVVRDAARYSPARAAVVPWLLGIARNYVRRRAAQRPVEELTAATAPALAATQHDAVERDERLLILRRELARLPDAYREAIVLCDLQELSYADAASAIGCAIGTVRSRLHRGRALLTAAMSGSEVAPHHWLVPKWIV